MEKLTTNFHSQDIFDKYPLREKAGIRDWILNYFFDLSCFSSNIVKRLSGIIIHHTEEYIAAIEFFYDSISSGLYTGQHFDKIIKSEIIMTRIDICDGDFVDFIFGSFNVDYITNLTIHLKSGVSKGFNNNLVKDKTDIKYFLFKQDNSEIISFKMAFGKFLTFISPVFRGLNERLIFPYYESNNIKLFSSKMLGKKFDDSKNFYYKNELSNGKIKHITLYHDNSLVKGLSVQYENLKVDYFNILDDSMIKEELSLDYNNGEEINKIFIKSGDLIDNITLYTNKGKWVSAGGFGGGSFLFNIEHLREQINNPNIKFCGFSGGYQNNIHYLQLIVTE